MVSNQSQLVSTFKTLLDIQSWWEVPTISHFCSLFNSALNFPNIAIEDLESALLSHGTTTDDVYHLDLLPELITHLLKGCTILCSDRGKVNLINYEFFLRRALRKHCRLQNTENHYDNNVNFQSLPMRKRLLILYDVCLIRLDSPDAQTAMSKLKTEILRVEPLGYDSDGSAYFYFCGIRLYREVNPPATSNTFKANSIWQVICFTQDDWQRLAKKFESSRNAKEQKLYQVLKHNYLPKLPELFHENERLMRKKRSQYRILHQSSKT